jgi:hypothetical protein
MVYPPSHLRDYVFIVVPDTWTFHDKAARSSVGPQSSTAGSTVSPSTGPLDRSRFLTPSKQLPTQPVPPPDTAFTSLSSGTAYRTSFLALVDHCYNSTVSREQLQFLEKTSILR